MFEKQNKYNNVTSKTTKQFDRKDWIYFSVKYS